MKDITVMYRQATPSKKTTSNIFYKCFIYNQTTRLPLYDTDKIY